MSQTVAHQMSEMNGSVVMIQMVVVQQDRRIGRRDLMSMVEKLNKFKTNDSKFYGTPATISFVKQHWRKIFSDRSSISHVIVEK